MDTVSDLVGHGQFTYAEFRAGVDADCPAADAGWDHFVDRVLRQLKANDPPLYSEPHL